MGGTIGVRDLQLALRWEKSQDVTVGLDVDGVLLNWIDPFHAWMCDNNMHLINPYAYDMAEAYDLDYDEAAEYIAEFGESKYMSRLKAYSDAATWVPYLHHRHEYNFIAITVFNKKIKRDRERNLKNQFLFKFKDVICVDRHRDKRDVLAQFSETSNWWIEDKVTNANIGLDAGLKSIVRTQPWNESWELHKDITRCENWREIYTTITNYDKSN